MDTVTCPLCRKDTNVREEDELPKQCFHCDAAWDYVCPECLTVELEPLIYCRKCGAAL